MNRKNSGDDDSFEKEKEIIARRDRQKERGNKSAKRWRKNLILQDQKYNRGVSRREREAQVPREERRKDPAGILKGEKERERPGHGGKSTSWRKRENETDGEKERGKWTIRGRGTPEERRVNGTRGETEKKRERKGAKWSERDGDEE